MSATAFGDNLKSILDFAKLLKNFNLDLPKLQSLFSLLQGIGNAPDTKTKVLASIELLRTLATMTVTTIDDNLVKFADALQKLGALDVIVRLVDQRLNVQVQALDNEAAVRMLTEDAEVQALGLDPMFLLTVVNAIVELLKLFKK